MGAIITKTIIKAPIDWSFFVCYTFLMKYKILEHPADLKIRAFGKNKKELFLNMLQGLQDSLKPNLKSLPPQRDPAKGGKISKVKTIRVKSSNSETLLVDFLSEILYLIQVNKEIYDKIKFLKFFDTEIEAELSGQKVESFSEDIKGVTYHGLEIKKNKRDLWQATVLFDI